MHRRIRQLVAASASSLVILGLGGVVGMPSASALPATRFVATTGTDTANTCLVSSAPCLTLGHALTQAAAGDTIQLAPGPYLVSDNPTGTSNLVPQSLHDLTIQSNPTGGTAANTIIDAVGESRGLTVNADNVTVKNLTFRNAEIEGIVAEPIDPPGTAFVNNLTLTGNAITNNNQCSHHALASGCTRQSSSLLPFGQAVALSGVVDSSVTGNTITGNWGGISLAEGSGNTISGNTVNNNGTQPVLGNGGAITGGNRFGAAGITLVGGYATRAGHDNTVSGNTVNGNGYIGIHLLAGGFQSNVLSGNTITGNHVNDNWGVGIAIKNFDPLMNTNGNEITGNNLSNNGLHAGFAGSGPNPPGDIDAGIEHTAGIVVLSANTPPIAGTPIKGTVITGNTITDEFYGVWMSVRIPQANVSGNDITVDAGGAPILVERANVVPIVGIARTPSGHGYWEVQSDGTVFPFGDAGYFGSLGGIALAKPVVGIAATPSGNGYWLVASDGGVFSFGDAAFHGSTGAIHLNQPIVGIAAGPGGAGYWLVASDGGIFSFGSAAFHGSTGAMHLNRPIVGMAAGPGGAGYWLVASDGGIFSFGSAKFHGSTGAIHLNQPVVGMAAGPGGAGYWLVASDGGIFSFGTAKFHGSTGAIHLNQPITGMAATPTNLGYWLAARDGGIFAFPDARFFGSEPGNS